MADNLTAVPAPPPAPACGCPQQGGITYHRRGTCPDPVVAKLDWYGTPPAPAPEAATPDPAAMEAALAEALKGMRVSVTVDAIEATAGTVTYPAQLAAMLWPELAPAWDALAARLAQAEAERDKLDKALEAFHRLNASRERSLYAALIDVWHHDGGNADEILAEAVDGYDGPQWDGTETGMQWLERTRGDRDAG